MTDLKQIQFTLKKKTNFNDVDQAINKIGVKSRFVKGKFGANSTPKP